MEQINGPQFNPFDYPDEVCSECGHNVFVPGVVFKKVPGILVGDGTREYVPIPLKVAVCQKCGAMSPSDKKTFDEAEKNKEKKTSGSSSLII